MIAIRSVATIASKITTMQLVSLARGARVLGVSPDTLKKLIDSGEVKTIRVSPSRVKIDLPRLIEWTERGGMQAPTGQEQ